MPPALSSPDASPLTPLEAIHPERARAHVASMRTRYPGADPTALLPDVDPRRIPRHIAIIMDGNGRWAAERDLPRMFGHRNGAVSVRTALKTVSTLGVECLTLYSFSMENWKRPADEVEQLMQLYLTYMDGERESLVRQNIRFRQIGRREGLPDAALEALDKTLEATRRCTGPTLCLAVNYGSRDEILHATRRLAQRVRAGSIDPMDIDEDVFDSELFTRGLPEPDLLIRTAGERRLSNFLLWQLSYAELYVTPTLWPDFGRDDMLDAVRDYASRERRFGGLSPDSDA
ncbi:MAG: isoprenyl transferase [Phycisphaerales bacterium]